MELQLGLAISSNLPPGFDLNQECDSYKKKRVFEEAFLDVEKNVKVPRTLPLLVWDDKKQSNEELDEQEVIIQKSVTANRNIGDAEDDIVVGWPPVKSWRRKFCQQSRHECATNYVTVENGGGGGGGGGSVTSGSNSMYVKVKMEGVGIARKVDLSVHNSYQTLVTNLIAMFGKCEENVDMYKLTYQDQEGDWMLAGDVPWGSFIGSVQRLKLLKNCN